MCYLRKSCSVFQWSVGGGYEYLKCGGGKDGVRFFIN